MELSGAGIAIDYDSDANRDEARQDAKSLVEKHKERLRPTTDADIDQLISAVNHDASQLGMPFKVRRATTEQEKRINEKIEKINPLLKMLKTVQFMANAEKFVSAYEEAFEDITAEYLRQFTEATDLGFSFIALGNPLIHTLAHLAKTLGADEPEAAKGIFMRLFLMNALDHIINNDHDEGCPVRQLNISLEDFMADIECVKNNKTEDRVQELNKIYIDLKKVQNNQVSIQ